MNLSLIVLVGIIYGDEFGLIMFVSGSRCCQIMGRSEQDELTAAQILYPCMQCADIFFLKVLAFYFIFSSYLAMFYPFLWLRFLLLVLTISCNALFA